MRAVIVSALVITGFLCLSSSALSVLQKPAAPTVAVSVSEQYEQQRKFWRNRLTRDSHAVQARLQFAEASIALARATGEDALYGEAEEVLKEAHTLQPNNGAVQLMLARVGLASHKFKDAITLTNDLANGSYSAAATIVRLDALIGLGRYEEAKSEIEPLLQKSPGSAVWSRAAHIETLYGRTDAALALLDKAIENSKQAGPEPRAWLELRKGIVYLKLGEIPAARKQFEASLAIAPDYYLALEHLAETYEIEEDSEEARFFLTQAISVKRSPELLLRLAALEHEIGDESNAVALEKEALEAAATAYQKDPGHARDYAVLLLERPGSEQEALTAARVDWEMRPGDLESNYVLARALLQAGQAEQAGKYIDRALRLGSAPQEYQEIAALIEEASI